MRVRLPPKAVLAMALALGLAQMTAPFEGLLSQRLPGRVFLGFRYMAGDHYQYAGFIEQARETGRMLMVNPFTNQPQAGVFLMPFFWVVGLVSRALGTSIPWTWDLFRVVGAVGYVLVSWEFSGHDLAQHH